MDPIFPQGRIFASLHSDPMRESYRRGFLAGRQAERARILQPLADRAPTPEPPEPTGIPTGEPKLIIEQDTEEG